MEMKLKNDGILKIRFGDIPVDKGGKRCNFHCYFGTIPHMSDK